MSIKQDTDYVGLKVFATRDIWRDEAPEPAEIIEVVGLGDYAVRFDDGEALTVNECDIWDSLEEYEHADRQEEK